MKQQISTTRLEHLMPHRGKMIWVDQVESYSDKEGVVSITLNETYPYFIQDQELMRSFFLEFMAQGYGFYRAAQVLDQDLEGLDKAMIPMISKYKYRERNYKPGMTFTAKLETLKELGDLFFVKGECFDELGECVASAEFKVYAKAEL
jgi:predicted hotdog family 3-hydroxylacyl-ACP dehydratase